MEKEVYRVDQAVNADSEVTTTDEGFLRINAPVARTGVYVYKLPNGEVLRELVTEETLSSREANETLHLKPVTNGHPKKMVDTASAKKSKIGSVGENVWFDSEYLRASFVVTDQDAIDSIKDGRIQLSPAYKCVLLQQSGVHEGEEYDCIQIGRRYNHLALVDNARGGSSLSFKMDSDDYAGGSVVNSGKKEKPNKGVDMKKIKLDGVEVEVVDGVKSHIDGLEAKLDTKVQELKALDGKISEIQIVLDGKDEAVKGLVDSAVKERVSLVVAFGTVKGENDNCDGMTNREIKEFVIAKIQPTAVVEEKSDEYVTARFDACVELKNSSKDESEDKGSGADEISRQRRDSAGNDGSGTEKVDHRGQMLKDDLELWKEEA